MIVNLGSTPIRRSPPASVGVWVRLNGLSALPQKLIKSYLQPGPAERRTKLMFGDQMRPRQVKIGNIAIEAGHPTRFIHMHDCLRAAIT